LRPQICISKLFLIARSQHFCLLKRFTCQRFLSSGIVKPLSVNFYLLIMNLSDQ
jgi:hypothetical protein